MRFIKLITISLLAVQISIVKADQYVEQTVTAWMKQNQVPGVSMQVYDHGKAQAYYFGVADISTKKPVDQNTIFEVGSFTKLFTALLLAQQVNLKKITLSDPAADHLQGITTNATFKKITLENLATHTAGLPFKPDTIYDYGSLIKYLAHWQPAAPIGTQWAYSNMSIGMLGLALEQVTHKNLNQMYRSNILLPLGMQSIGITVPKKIINNYAQGYDKDNKPVVRDSIGFFAAAGDMKLSAYDSQLFLRAALGLSNNESINAAMQLTQTPFFNVADWQQGLGWVIHCDPMHQKQKLLSPSKEMNRGPLKAVAVAANQQTYNGNCLIDKTEGTEGFRGYIVVIPNQKSGVVILTNRYVPDGEITKLGREILFSKLT